MPVVVFFHSCNLEDKAPSWSDNCNIHQNLEKEFDSGLSGPSALITQGKTFSHTFATEGKLHYFCQLHPTMIGKVVVTKWVAKKIKARRIGRVTCLYFPCVWDGTLGRKFASHDPCHPKLLIDSGSDGWRNISGYSWQCSIIYELGPAKLA
jgi:copper binding plastocyanin/azurin family protein